MLPELLFSVGSSMQDISRDEFSLLNHGGCDKDASTVVITGGSADHHHHHHHSTNLDRIKLLAGGQTPDDLEPVSIKLEEPDIFPWNTQTDIGSNLLRHSDDPLISGAIDDNQNEFNPIASCDTTIPTTSTSPLIAATPPNRKKPTRTRRKGQFKLRFHHQALPQEYLDHYEATQNSLQKKEAEQLQKQLQNSSMESNDQLQAARTHDSVRNWLQKISEFQGEIVTNTPLKQEPMEYELAQNSKMLSAPAIQVSQKKQHHTSTTRVVSYKDLPYMGEMTLDNSKPRRGRKPKKADICHLIYKNYGTILPGTPKDQHHCNKLVVPQPEQSPLLASNDKSLNLMDTTPSSSDTKKNDLQSKLMSSLLEKRLTREGKSRLSPTSTVPAKGELKIIDGKLQAEPLNLCVRDRSDTLTVSSDYDDRDSLIIESSRTSPLILPSDTDSLLAANLKMSLPNFQTALLDKLPSTSETPSTGGSGDSTANPSNYVYWPGAGVFIHPMALYYQKMVDAGTSASVQPSNTTTSTQSTVSTPAVSPMPPLSSPTPPITLLTAKSEPTAKILIPKNISQLLKQKNISTSPTTVIKTPSPLGTMSEASSSTSSKSTTPAPQKRKRSAIFIPPMPPADTSPSSHATEVSICKFKFTGGAKPSLQEKKMLSVDSGGNFRYYSGTGDKSMRGYEFFPRESLQQSSLVAGSSAGAFLNTPGEKISIDLPPPSHGLSNELLQIPDLPSPGVSSVVGLPVLSAVPSSSSSGTHRRISHSSDRRKRKSRRSLQREKLEKTFKEKGFLIQTQQLESAEGATYCKFRQLRKFTRYLFRSWKDYLPGELQHGQHPPIMGIEDDSSPIIIADDVHQLSDSPPQLARINLPSTSSLSGPSIINLDSTSSS